MLADCSKQGRETILLEGNNQAVSWRVVAVHDESRWVPGGAPERMKRVHFELDDGSRDHVLIPAAQFTTATVQKEVEAAARRLASILMMSGHIPFDSMMGNDPNSEVQY